MIRLQCPSCGARLRAPDEALGKKTKCPQCASLVVVDPAVNSGLDEILDPEEIPSDDPYGLADGDVGASKLSTPAGEDRKPCPMCGEQILKTAAKCRFCGEVFDDALRARSVDPKTLKDFRKNIHGLSGIWIFFGFICGLLIAAAQAGGNAMNNQGFESSSATIVFGVLCALWLTVGIFSGLKQMWAVYLGLAFSYLSLAGNVYSFFTGEGPGAAKTGNIIGLAIVGAVIAQAHRTIGLAGKLKKSRIPLTAKP